MATMSVRRNHENAIWPVRRLPSGKPAAIGVILAVAATVISGCAVGGAATPTARPTASPTASPTPSPKPGTVMHVDIRVPIASSTKVGAPCGASSFGSHSYAGTPLSSIPGAKFTLGVLRGQQDVAEETVPATGTIVARGGDDPVFRTDCSFRFDVPLEPSVETYVFSVGKIYFPVPIISRTQLAATGWTATLGVNVDQ
jgi:hypothetical protein